ncbi:MAG: type II toxin-antitoxin system VapB family antitoxin [Acidobacteriota bacterium]
MPLSIKDSETDELARRLAEETGESITEAIKQAVRERLARERLKQEKVNLSERLLRIGTRCASHLGGGKAHSLDHGELLYDEKGLPR